MDSGIETASRSATVISRGVFWAGDVCSHDSTPSSGTDDVITVAAGEHRAYQLDDEERFENVVIDQRAPDSSFTIRADGRGGWQVRNVGFRGVGQVGEEEGVFQLTMAVPAGRTGRVENVFIDGRRTASEAPPTEIGGLFAQAGHAGHIDVRHTFVAGMGNNAAYLSNPGKDGYADGSITHRYCYHRDNTVSQFRIGTPDAEIHNCVGIVADPDGRRGVYPGTTSQRARCVWARHHQSQRVVDSAFYYAPTDVQRPGAQAFHAEHLSGRSNGARAELVLDGCDINADVPDGELIQTDGEATVIQDGLGHDPSVDVLDEGGVPTSPTMAASGGREYPAPAELDR